MVAPGRAGAMAAGRMVPPVRIRRLLPARAPLGGALRPELRLPVGAPLRTRRGALRPAASDALSPDLLPLVTGAPGAIRRHGLVPLPRPSHFRRRAPFPDTAPGLP